MKTDELIVQLLKIKEKYGNIDVEIEDSDCFDTPIHDIAYINNKILICANNIADKHNCDFYYVVADTNKTPIS